MAAPHPQGGVRGGHVCLSAEGERLAAVLACGPGAVLSHRSAAAHWGFLSSAAAYIDVAVPCCGGRRARPGIRIHRHGALGKSEVTTLRGVPVTTTAGTLLQLATTSPRRVLERAIEETERLGLFDLVELQGLLDAGRGRAGSVTLRSILTDHPFGTTVTRSELEERFLALCEQGGLARPLVNSRLDGFEVDFLWRDERLVVETDGHAGHRTRAAFERDRARDARLTVAGYRVVRFTYRQVVYEARAVTVTVRKLLRQSS